MVTGFLELALTNAALATILAGVVWVIGRRCHRPQWMYGLWLLVLLKLVTPPVYSFSIHVGCTESAANQSSRKLDKAANRSAGAASVLDVPAAAAAAELEPTGDLIARFAPASVPAIDLQPFESRMVDSSIVDIQRSGAISRDVDSIEPSNHQSRATLRVKWQESRTVIVATLTSLWLAGSLFWMALVTHRTWRFSRLIRQADPAPAWLQSEAHTLTRRLGLRRLPELLMVEGRLSPFLWAAPSVACVVLPAPLLRTAARPQIVALLAHELAHYRRGDHYCRWFELLVLSLFWWHPVAWWARRQLHRAEEECCDVWVLRALPDYSRVYAGAILATLDFLSGAQPVMPALASGLGAADVLERRLTMILQGPLPRRLSFRSQLGFLLVAVVVLPLSARAQESSAPELSPDVAPVAGNGVTGRELGGSQVTPQLPEPTAGSADVAPSTTSQLVAPTTLELPSTDIRPSGTVNPTPPLAPPAAGFPSQRLSNDQSIEARMDRLEKMVSDIAAAVGRGGGSTPAYGEGNNYAFPRRPGMEMAMRFQPNSLAELKKHRVDLEVQVDAMREQIARLQQDMRKLDEAIADHEEKRRAQDDLLEPRRAEPRLP